MSNHSFYQDPAATAAFERIKNVLPVSPYAARTKAVVIGGGTGAPVSIRTLLSLGAQTSAVVAMADDGGSTGILREKADVTPPGDIRKCLAAFAADPDDPLTRAFKYRLDFAQNHTLGNLMISALEDATGSFPAAIEICEDLLHARGHVYPSTLEKIILCGKTCDGVEIEGQAHLSHSKTALSRVWLKEPVTMAGYSEALQAIRTADIIVLGPGSLFTSIIPNLLVPGVVRAIAESKGKTLFVCGLADMQGETWGMSAEEHVGALLDHGMDGLLDYVLLHTPQRLRAQDGEAIARQPDLLLANGIRPVPISYAAARRIQSKGPMVIARNLVDPARPTWHDPAALRDAFTGVLKLCRSRRM